MTREEFNKILVNETKTEVEEVFKSVNKKHYESQGDFLTEVIAKTIATSTNIIVASLEKANVLKYDD